jgi:ABC-type nitrate/sulfonate/bicarbonate transport system permease component
MATMTSTETGNEAGRSEPSLVAAGMRTTLWNFISLACALGLWQFAAAFVGSPFFPGPLKIIDAFVQLATRGDTFGNSLLTHSWASIQRVLVGFGFGVLLAVPIGLLMGLYPKVYAGTRSVLEPFRFIPPIAWIPLAIIFFSGLTRFAFLIFLGAFFPVFTSTLVGVARVEPIHRKVGVVHGASKFWTLRHVVVPTVLPDIMAGMRVGLGTAWLTIVAAELAGGISTGLGRMMTNYAELLQVPQVIVGMLLIGFIGFLMNEVLLLIEKRLFRWRWQVRL